VALIQPPISILSSFQKSSYTKFGLRSLIGTSCRRLFLLKNDEGYGLLTIADLSDDEQNELEKTGFELVGHSACAHCTHVCTHEMHTNLFNSRQTLLLQHLSMRKDKRSFFEIINEIYRENIMAEKAREDMMAEVNERRYDDKSHMWRY
jgi:hypothetical protein